MMFRDFKHIAANEFKPLLEQYNRFAQFQTKLGQTRSTLQPTYGAHASVACSQENARQINRGDAIGRVVTLNQNWSDEESNWFYSIPQGSRLMPYEWFLYLEQPTSKSAFLDPNHIRDLGYIPWIASTDNPDGLPVGFVKDANYDDGTAGLGFTCAVCHTSQINYGNVGYIIDGGPTMGDMQTLMKRLAASLDSTVKQDDKFLRFAGKLFGFDNSKEYRKSLRSALQSAASARDGYNMRNFPNEDTEGFGHGRVDAFGAIFNEAAVTFLGISENVLLASAPVSYPCLWDAPQHDRVQWNGAAENQTSESMMQSKFRPTTTNCVHLLTLSEPN